MVTSGRIGGWLYEQEDREYLRNSSLPSQTERLKNLRTWKRPDSVDPRPWLQIENQAQLGSCQGHALSSAVELAYFFEAGQPIQFSRMFAYIMSQRKDGIRGDSGSTISGGSRCAKEDGLCLEDTFPYTGRYSTDIPAKCVEEAKSYKVRTTVKIQSYDDAIEWLASGVGGINIGIMWTLGDEGVVESYREGRGGGHALCWGGYSERKDSAGKNYILMANSWGRRWGNNGWCEVSPKASQQMLDGRYTEAHGLSDMVNIEPRKIEYKFL